MIETRELTKIYGELYALDRLTIRLEKGDVYGFIGPNGAGKTTTMRMLATLLEPSSGQATVAGCDLLAEPVLPGQPRVRRPEGRHRPRTLHQARCGVCALCRHALVGNLKA